jgi:predicted dehydrogenase
VTLRIGVIGCGSIARRAHLPALKQCDDVDVVAFASRTLASAEAAAGEWGGGDVTDDWRAVIDRDDVDAVVVCTPNALHCEQTVAAANARKHVLVEKPMAATLEQADEMNAVAEGAGVVLRVAHNLRYVPAVIAAQQAVTKVGTIVAVRLAYGHAGPHDWAGATWFFDAAQSGGGALIDLGIHGLDLIRFVTGLEATEVTCMLTGDGAVEDAAFITIGLDGGAAALVHVSWVTRPPPEFALGIYGSDGTLSLGFGGLTFRSASGTKESIEGTPVTATPCSDFVRVVRGEAPEGPAASGDEGRAALAIVAAAYESARTGKRQMVAR